MKQLIIIGAGGHGRVVKDIIQNKYDNIIFLDDDSNNKLALGPISLHKNYLLDSDFFIAIGNNELREKIFNEISSNKGNIISVISDTAKIGDNVTIGKNVVIMHYAVINNGSIIEDGSIINTYSSVDHDCVIGNFSHVAVGAHLAGTVKIGKRVFIGTNAGIINNINIIDNTIIGSGANVIKDINEAGIYVGVPARKIK